MDIDPAAVLAEARRRALQERLQRRHEEAERARERRERIVAGASFVEEYLSPADSADYTVWLRGWLLQGGKIGHVYDRAMWTENKLYFATKDFVEMPKMYGADAVEIIIPAGINAPKYPGHTSYGHSILYFMDGFEIYGSDLPAAYSDTVL